MRYAEAGVEYCLKCRDNADDHNLPNENNEGYKHGRKWSNDAYLGTRS